MEFSGTVVLPSESEPIVRYDGRLYQLMDGNAGLSPAVRATCAGWDVPR